MTAPPPPPSARDTEPAAPAAHAPTTADATTPPTVPAASATGRRRRATGRPSTVWALPGLLFFGFFAAVPMVLVAYLSFTEWDGLSAPTWTGLANWSRLFDDPAMLNALWLSLLLTVFSWAFQTPIALLLGVWAAGRQRTRAVLSAVFFLPLLASSVALALVWRSILDPNFGLAADVAGWLNLDHANVLGNPTGAFAAIAFIAAWQFIPLHTLLYQGGARQIPQSLYDAASIDGAGTVRQFFSVTVPQLRNTIVTSSVLMVVGALTYFDTVLILTAGGPGDATTILPYLMYKTGFEAFDLGYASAVATTLVIAATVVSLLMVRLTGFSRMRSTREGM